LLLKFYIILFNRGIAILVCSVNLVVKFSFGMEPGVGLWVYYKSRCNTGSGVRRIRNGLCV